MLADRHLGVFGILTMASTLPIKLKSFLKMKQLIKLLIFQRLVNQDLITEPPLINLQTAFSVQLILACLSRVSVVKVVFVTLSYCCGILLAVANSPSIHNEGWQRRSKT